MATTGKIDVDIEFCEIAGQSLEYSTLKDDLDFLLSGIESQMTVSSGAVPVEVHKLNQSLRRLADELCGLYDQTKSLLYNVSDIWEAADSDASNNIGQ
jgi:hypothetical protein